jgi:hypothetical protein
LLWNPHSLLFSEYWGVKWLGLEADHSHALPRIRMSKVVPVLPPCAFMVCPRPFPVFYLLLRSLLLAFDKDQVIYVFFNNSVAVSSSA